MWHVWEEDQAGHGVMYRYATRRAARAHIRRVRNNPFLGGAGWLVRLADWRGTTTTVLPAHVQAYTERVI